MTSRAQQHHRRRTTRRALSLAGIALTVAIACEESGPRVYTAQAYDAEAGCLEAYAPIGLVQAEVLDSTCDAVCLRLDAQLYVSTVCSPFPAEASEESPRTSPECRTALTAQEAELSCESADAGAESDE